MLDFRTFPLLGSRLIEASAGTGKTYTIAMLYVRYVLGHGQAAAYPRRLSPSEILVVTFTDAASQELRDRIRQRLAEAARWFAQPEWADTHDPLFQILSDYDADQRQQAAEVLERAAETMDEAAVSTIHGWCYRMLREHAFASNLVFNQQLNANPSDVLAECVEDYWRQHFYPFADRPALAAVLDRWWRSPVALRQTLHGLIGKNEFRPVLQGQSIAAPTDLGPLLEQAIVEQEELDRQLVAAETARQEAQLVIRDHWPEVARLLTQAELNATSYHKGATRDKLLNTVRQWADGRTLKDGDLGKIRLLGTGSFKLKKNAAEPVHAAFDAIARWSELWVEPTADENLACRTAVLLHARQWVVDALEQRMRARGELSYDDMLRRLHAALHGPEGDRLAAAIRHKYPAAMIDEFQDTDAIQYAIFNRIYRIGDNDPQTSFIMIGDPKQAIYAFRGADIYTYLQAKRDCDSRCETLDTNHRSTVGMVQAVNHLFTHAEQHDGGAFRFRQPSLGDPIPYQPVEARGRNEVLEIAGQPVVPLQFWYLPGLNENGVTGPGSYRRQMADASASQIVQWLEMARDDLAGFRTSQGFRRLQPRDIAILVRTGSEAAEIRQSLQHRGVNSVYLSDKDSVFETSEARDLQRWLLAVANPNDERLLKAALATGALRLPLPRLRELFEQEEQWEETVERFRRYQKLWQSQGVLPMLRALLWDFDTPERCLAEPQGERSLTNLLHLSEWLQQTSGSVDGELALIRRLAQQIDHPTEEQILRLESDADLIKVVTIHKSKGLEYPLVLLPFICTFRDNARQSFVDFHRWSPEGGHYPLWTELAGQRKLAEESYLQADEERLNEDLRLLYVALTRAQHGLWLGVTPLGGMAQSRAHQLNRSAVGQLLFGQTAVAAADVPRAIQAILEPCNSIAFGAVPAIERHRITPPRDTQLGPARVATRREQPRWWIASYSALRTKQEAAPELARDEQAAEEPWSAEPGERGQTELGVTESSVSAMVLSAGSPGTTSESPTELDSRPLESMHSFPRGPHAGTFLHGILEWVTERGFDRVAQDPMLRQNYLQRIARSSGWSPWVEVLDLWLSRLLDTNLPIGSNPAEIGLRLADVSAAQSCAELEFWFEVNRVATDQLDRLVIPQTLQGRKRPALERNSLNGLLKGFIDLVFVHRERYYILDWKSNYLGIDAQAYDLESLREAIAEKRYDLQYVLYLLALHRHLQDRLPGYRYETHVGGAAYVFLRGVEHPTTCGVHFELPPASLIHALDELFIGAKRPELHA